MTAQSDFKTKKAPVLPIHSPNTFENGTMKPETKAEERNMADNTYTKEEIDKKFDKLEKKIDNLYTKTEIDLKFDNLEQRIENMFLNFTNRQLEEQAKNRKEFTYWFIGILIALASIAIPIWFGK